MYRFAASFQATFAGMMLIFVHIPSVRIDSVLNLYRYFPTPLLLGKDPKDQPLFMTPLPYHSYLALSSDTTLSRAMTDVQFASCTRELGHYVCPHTNVYDKRQDGSSCLLSLYHNNEAEISSNCKWTIHSQQDSLSQLGPHTFLVFQATPGIITVRCLNPVSEDSMTGQGLFLISANSSCRGSSRSFLFDGELDVSMAPIRLEPRFLNLTNLWLHAGGQSDLSAISDRLKNIGNLHGITLTNLVSQLDMSTHDSYVKGAFLFGFLFLLLIVLVLVGFRLRKYCLRRRLVHSHAPEDIPLQSHRSCSSHQSCHDPTCTKPDSPEADLKDFDGP